MAASDPNHPNHIPFLRDIVIPGYEAKILELGTLFAAKKGEATACNEAINEIKARCDTVAEQIKAATSESNKNELTEKLVDLTARKLAFKCRLEDLEEEAESLFMQIAHLARLKNQAINHLKYHI